MSAIGAALMTSSRKVGYTVPPVGISKFGACTTPTVLGNLPADIWDFAQTIPQYTWPAAADYITIESSDAADTLLGAGARTVLVSGLDADCAELSYEFSMNGVTPVVSTEKFYRVNRAYVTSTGNGGNIGTLTVKHVTSGDTLAGVLAGNGQTLMALWTVPCTWRQGGIPTRIYASIASKVSASAVVQVQTNTDSQGWRVRAMQAVNSNSNWDEQTQATDALPQGTDIRVRVIDASAGALTVAGGFAGYRIY